MRSLRRRGLVLALVIALAPPSLAATTNDVADTARRIEKLLAAPPTPAVVLQLLEGAGDPRVQTYWAASLSHADPTIRGAASRAIRVAGLSRLSATLATTLASESDAMAASEHADALIELTGRPHATALEAARRSPQVLQRSLLFTLARVAPGTVPVHLDLLIPADAATDDAVLVLSQLRRAYPAVADEVLAGSSSAARVPPGES
jgi:hypothetical protein